MAEARLTIVMDDTLKAHLEDALARINAALKALDEWAAYSENAADEPIIVEIRAALTGQTTEATDA